jgi:hypothetical protein
VEIAAGVLATWCVERDGDREWKLECPLQQVSAQYLFGQTLEQVEP